jgi:hypothetical protein
MNNMNTIAALLLGLITMVGSAFTIDSRYAKVTDVSDLKYEIYMVDQRLHLKISSDRATYLQERIWKYTDRYEGKEIPDTVKEMIRDMQKEYDGIMEDIKKQSIDPKAPGEKA